MIRQDRMTSTTGIGLMVQTLMRSPVYPELLKHLPERVDNFEELQDDEYLTSLLGGRVPAPRTILDYLNDFEPHQIAGLNSVLNTMGKTFHSL
jgi:hypothetical protein